MKMNRMRIVAACVFHLSLATAVLADTQTLRPVTIRILKQYSEQVHTHILRQWAVPAKIKMMRPSQRPSVVLSVQINGDGTITKITWEQRSGHDSLDKSVFRAVQLANPLPPPPEKIRKLILREQFLVTFKP